MPWTYATLKTAAAALGGSPTPAQAAATLNAQTAVGAAQDVAWSAIRDVLMNDFDWGTLVQAATIAVGGTLPGGGTQTLAIQAAAASIRECCLYGGTFAASNATVWARLVAAANLLTPASVGAITSASASAVVALRTPTVRVWDPPVTSGDVQTAGVQP
jgi:hypothetical protein